MESVIKDNSISIVLKDGVNVRLVNRESYKGAVNKFYSFHFTISFCTDEVLSEFWLSKSVASVFCFQ